jgi:CheY-like chemotaxis protein
MVAPGAPGGAEPRRVFLRAEIRVAGRELIAHTREISRGGAVVFADNIAAVGDRVLLKLSLPRHVAPLVFQGEVIGLGGSGQPGDPGTVHIRFDPVADAVARGLEELFRRLDEEAQAVSGGSYRVLVVDDNEMMRDLFAYGVRKYFRRSGTQVIVDGAADGLAAWRMLQTVAYDLAVVDCYLPVLDGARLVERIRGQAELADLLIVGVSGGGRDAADAMLAAGVDLFLDKPIVLRDVFSTLESLTRGAPDDGRAQAGLDPR